MFISFLIYWYLLNSKGNFLPSNPPLKDISLKVKYSDSKTTQNFFSIAHSVQCQPPFHMDSKIVLKIKEYFILKIGFGVGWEEQNGIEKFFLLKKCRRNTLKKSGKNHFFAHKNENISKSWGQTRIVHVRMHLSNAFLFELAQWN